MSVLLINRTESRFEAVVFASEIQSLIRDLMRRNFCVKDYYYLSNLKDLYGKYKMDQYKIYVTKMDTHRIKIDRLCGNLSQSLRAAEFLYPTNMGEYERRREHLDDAIGFCQGINGELMQIIKDFRYVDINGFKPLSDAINREIDLIKRWRQRDNKFKLRFNNKG